MRVQLKRPKCLGIWIGAFVCLSLLAGTGQAQSTELVKAKALYAEGKRREAKNILERITKSKGASAESFSILGMILMDPPFANARAAGTQFQNAMVRNPADLNGNLGAGILMLRSRKPTKALRFLRKATQIAPQYPDAHLHLGKALYALQRISEALAEFQLARALPEGLEYLAIVEFGRQRHAVAAQHLEVLVASLPPKDPKRPRLLYQLAASLVMASSLERGEKMLQETVDGGFVRAEALNELARLAYERDDFVRAKALYQQALGAPSIKSKAGDRAAQSTARYSLGLIACREKRYQPARVHLDKAIAIDPFHQNAWYKLGQTLQRLKLKPEAKAAFAFHKRIQPLHQKLRSAELSVANNPKILKNWVANGQLLLLLGRPKEALSKLLLLEQLDPNFPGLAALLADTAKALNLPGREKLYRSRAAIEAGENKESN
ncbi:MAG: tetratricopeptide repeat protein [Planctomycetota bacterium]